MGGTDENNFLNSIGKAKDGSGDGDILVWKRKVSAKVLSKRSNKRTYVVDFMSLNSDSHRQAYFDFESFPFIDIKAEKYLLKSGLDYTIIHPGGLIDTPASQQQLVLDVDDKLLKKYEFPTDKRAQLDLKRAPPAPMEPAPAERACAYAKFIPARR